MASAGEVVIDFKANATEALRDINQAKRRLSFARYVWPMVAGAALVLVGAVVGFVLGVAS